MCPATLISENLQAPLFETMASSSKPSVEASLVKASLPLETALAWRIREVVFGANIGVSLASFDPGSSSWKTPQTCVILDWPKFSGTWPRSGMMRSGTVFQLPALAPITKETASGLLPTLRANKRGLPGSHGSTMAWKKLLPTLAARDYRYPNKKSYACRGGGKKGEQLPNVIGGQLNPTWVEWLMAWPLGHTACAHWATAKSRSKPRSPGDCSADQSGMG